MDLDKIKEFIKKETGKNGASVIELCKKLDIKDYELLGVIQLLKSEGFLIDVFGDNIVKLKKPLLNNDIYEVPCKLETIRLLLISDTHLVNKCSREDVLKYVYEKAEQRGVKQVLHIGDGQEC